MARSLHLRQSSVNSLDNKLRNPKRRVPPLVAVRLLIADDENARLFPENLSHGIVAETPERSDLGNAVVLYRKARGIIHGRESAAIDAP